MQFWTDLADVQLNEEEDKVTWLQALPLNKYTHPLHGVIDVTPERARRFAENVKNKVRGIDLDIDYDHKAKRDDAAGWVVDAEARLSEADSKRNGLWIAVNFTKEATQKIKEKHYRYFSSEFKNTWTNNDGVTFNDVLFGGGLTNRPFLKDIVPINLSEITDPDQPKEGSSVDELRKELGLPEDATDEQVLEAVKANKTAADEASKVTPNPAPKDGEGENKETPTELSEELVKLAETNPVVKLLLDEREETRKRLSEIEAATRNSNMTAKLSELTGPDAKHVLPPSVIESVKKLSENGDVTKEVQDQVFAMLSEVTKNGTVELGERGKSGEIQTADAATKLNDEVNKVMKADKVDYPTALAEVAEKQPSLYEDYQNELVGS